MSISTGQETLARLRRELLPEAERLRDLAAELGEDESPTDDEEASEGVRRDLAKLAKEAAQFHADVRERLDPSAFASGEDFETEMRSVRHDLRNRLNHLFGVIQLVQLAPCRSEIVEKSRDVLALLESCLSLVAGTATLSRPEAPEPPAAPHLEPGEETGHLLVADDDAENRSILQRLLEPCGFRIDFAVNGREALASMEQHDFDAVLLDIEMPEMDGFEVLSRLRESGQLRHTPVIVVTGLQEEQDAVRCIEIGAEDFLSRPIRPALLMARLNASLEKKRLREQVFEQHFTPELARELARNPDPMKMQARQAEVTVLFCDIRGFSSISERLGPSQTIDWLGGVMGEFSGIVIEHGGVLVDYTGDELMALWGAPNEQPDHAELACRAALEIMRRLPDVNETWRPVVDAETEVGIGINTGDALVGNVGTDRKFKYGPLGTTVNLASRVQGATRFLKTGLLVTGQTVSLLPDSFRKRRLCQVRVQNIRAPIDLYELEPPDASEEWGDHTSRYESALEEFERGNFRRASSILGDVLLANPNDGPGLQLMARVVDAMLKEGADFSPIWQLPGK